MFWMSFPVFGSITMILWFTGILMISLADKKTWLEWPGRICVLLGLFSLLFFTVLLWINLERPPMRTLGETRLWYTIFLSTVGIIIYFYFQPAIIDQPIFFFQPVNKVFCTCFIPDSLFYICKPDLFEVFPPVFSGIFSRKIEIIICSPFI